MRIRKISKTLVAAIFAVMVMAAGAAAQTWDCGASTNPGGASSVKATLSGSTLTISGSGAMANYTYNDNTQSGNAPWYDSRSSITSVIIGDGVTSIGDMAFLHCSGLTSVEIPNSVTSIGRSAFSWCSGLTSVTIPNGVTSIVYCAFTGCANLTSVTIPNSVTVIDSGAFQLCTGLRSVTIPNSVTSIVYGAFSGCTNLTSVTIPNSVTSIGKYVFDNCVGLTNIEVGNGNTAYSSVEGVLFNKTKDTLVVYPQGKQGPYSIPNSVTSFGYGAFLHCSGLTSVEIPNSVTVIDTAAFNSCTGLRSVTIPNSVTSIGQSAFNGCTGLTSVTIGNSVTSIGLFAFSRCTGLTSVIILSETPPFTLRAFETPDILSACLYVPQTAISAYDSFTPWINFRCIRSVESMRSVTFSSQGGSLVSPQLVGDGNHVARPTAPTRPNYYFNGWYLDPAYTNPWNFDTDIVSSDMVLYARWSTEPISVLTPSRVVPTAKPTEEATVIAPITQLSGEFTAGPNPVSKSLGSVNFYRQGRRVVNSELRIYDAVGNVVGKVKIRDNKTLGTQARRKVGSWDLTDRNGRQVSEGTYLVKGVLKTSDGKSEKVSVIVGVR